MQGLFTSKLSLRRHMRDVNHWEKSGMCVRVFPEDMTLAAMQKAHEMMHVNRPNQDHRHRDYGDPVGPCELHTANPGQCPGSHVCKHCEATLACHYGSGAQCEVGGKSFYPDAATLEKFPSYYPPQLVTAGA